MTTEFAIEPQNLTLPGLDEPVTSFAVFRAGQVIAADRVAFVARCCARRPWGRPFVIADALGGAFGTVTH